MIATCLKKLSIAFSLTLFLGSLQSYSRSMPVEPMISMSFHNESSNLLEITRYLVKNGVLNKNLVYQDSLLNKSVNFYSSKAVDKAYAKDIFITLLHENNLRLLETEAFAKIVPKAEGDLEAPFIPSKQLRNSDTFAATLVQLEAIKIQDIQAVLSYFLSGQGKVHKYDDKNLLLTGPSVLLKKVNSILQQLENNQKNELWNYKLKNHPAEEALSFLEKLNIISKDKDAAKALTSDTHNSLLIYGTKADYKKIAAALEKLDNRPNAKSKSQSIYVRPLEYTEAKKIADMLEKIKRKLNPPGFFRHLTHIQSGLPAGDYHVIADIATNSLIIDSTFEQYKDLNRVIRELDRKQAQMFFDVHILEIKKGFQFTFKTSGLGFINNDKGETASVVGWEPQEIFPTLKTDDTQIQDKLEAISKDLVLGVIKNDKVSIGSLKDIKTGAFIRLLNEDQNSRIVSSPFLLSNDGEEASFVTGNIVPYQVTKQETNQRPGEAATNTEYKTVEKENAEISLKVLAHTTKANELKMKLELDIKAILNYSSEGYPLTASQKFSQEFALRHGQTMFVGGFASNSEGTASKKIPFLGDIPLVGRFFTNSHPTYEDKRLLVFVTPYICWGPDDLQKIYHKKAGNIS